MTELGSVVNQAVKYSALCASLVSVSDLLFSACCREGGKLASWPS